MRKYKEYFQTLSEEELKQEGYKAMYRTFLSFRLWGHNPNRYSEKNLKIMINTMATLSDALHNLPGCLKNLENKQENREVTMSMLVYELSILYDYIEKIQNQKWLLDIKDSNINNLYEDIQEKMKKD